MRWGKLMDLWHRVTRQDAALLPPDEHGADDRERRLREAEQRMALSRSAHDRALTALRSEADLERRRYQRQ